MINHTDLGVIVKRLKGQKNNKYFFEGDNLQLSTPTSVIGPVSRERIIGQAIYSLGRKRIRRTLITITFSISCIYTSL